MLGNQAETNKQLRTRTGPGGSTGTGVGWKSSSIAAQQAKVWLTGGLLQTELAHGNKKKEAHVFKLNL